MKHHFEEEPDARIAASEGESRRFRRIQGGDAAKAAEDAAEEGAPFQRSFDIRLRTARGARFEVKKHSDNQEDSRPSSGPDSIGQKPASETLEAPLNEKPTAGIARTLFRKLFRP